MSFTHEQNIICSQTLMDGIAHKQTYLWAVICRSRGGLSANEKKEKFASNDILNYHSLKIFLPFHWSRAPRDLQITAHK